MRAHAILANRVSGDIIINVQYIHTGACLCVFKIERITYPEFPSCPFSSLKATDFNAFKDFSPITPIRRFLRMTPLVADKMKIAPA